MDLEDNKYLLAGLGALVVIVGAGLVLMGGGDQTSYGQETEDTTSPNNQQNTQTTQGENQGSSGDVIRVEMSGTSYNPSTIQVEKGDKIKFVNTDGYAHTVTVDALGIDKSVSGGQSTTVTVDKSGTFDLVCTIHAPQMSGEIQAS